MVENASCIPPLTCGHTPCGALARRTPNEHGGWTSVDFPSLGLYRDHSIGFRNASSGTQQIKQGVVHFR
jgi:hypothetical protein